MAAVLSRFLRQVPVSRCQARPGPPVYGKAAGQEADQGHTEGAAGLAHVIYLKYLYKNQTGER